MPTPQAIKGLSEPGDPTYQNYMSVITMPLGKTGGVPASVTGTASKIGVPTTVGVIGDSAPNNAGVNKGQLYTTNDSGEIVAYVDQTPRSAGTFDILALWARGCFQALDSVKADSGTTHAQFFNRGSRIIVPVKGDVSAGDLVGLVYDKTTLPNGGAVTSGNLGRNDNLFKIKPNTDSIVSTGLPISGGRGIQTVIGTVIEIRGSDSDGRKLRAASNDGDLAVVEIGGY